MRPLFSRVSWFLLLFSPVIVAIPAAQWGKSKQSDAVGKLVKQLGDDKYSKRETAVRDLAALGEKALPALKEAAEKEASLEIRLRAQKLVRIILMENRESQSLGLKLAVIFPGEFQMGSPNTEKERDAGEDQHPVRITEPFFMGKFEVTQGEYEQVMKTNPSWFSAKGRGSDKVNGLDTSRFPVDTISWFDALEFCNRLSQLDGYKPYYKLSKLERLGDTIRNAEVAILGGNGYRLPTEAEWEFACRSGTTGPYHAAGNIWELTNIKARSTVNYGGQVNRPHLGRTTTVGSYPANFWGLHDMHGNIAEFCEDWYEMNYYARSPVNDPPGPNTGQHRVLRGGSWLQNERNCRSASRFWNHPGDPMYYTGFRVARTP